MPRKKVLIIKTGYSETLERESGRIVSLGDVLRTTVILHLFPPDTHKVTWLTDRAALPLVENNDHIHRLLEIDSPQGEATIDEVFDLIINLEKDDQIVDRWDGCRAGQRFGFYRPAPNSNISAYGSMAGVLAMAESMDLRRMESRSWQQILYHCLNQNFEGQKCILGYEPTTVSEYDFGFNFAVGSKWPHKAWSMDNWKYLESKLGRFGSITWQQSLDNIHGYIDWINSCRMLITNDSLGMHLALAMDKPVVALFGPTPAGDVHDQVGLIKLLPEKNLKCLPCYEKTCSLDASCMHHISVETVFEAAYSLLGAGPIMAKRPHRPLDSSREAPRIQGVHKQDG